MEVLLTGGTGFVGANVVRHLLQRGDRVRCLVRESSPTLCLSGLDVERTFASLFDVDELTQAMRGVEGVYHVAGIYDSSPQGQKRMHAIHVEATRNLCEAALRAGVRRLLLCSSSITVGFGSLNDPGDECRPVGDADAFYGRDVPLRWYYDSKCASESLVSSYLDKGLETVIVNPDYVVGAWDLKPTSGAMIVAMAKGWLPFYPSGGKCFVDADDCAEGHLAAMDRGRPGERYLLGNHNLPYKDFMEIIAQVTGRRAPAAPLPPLLVRMAGRMGAGLRRIRPGFLKGLDPEVLRSMGQERYRSGRKAQEELGLPQTPLEISVEKAWEWFVEHGYC